MEDNAVFDNAWNDPRWVGSDVDFEECYYVFDKETNRLFYKRNDGLWGTYEVTQDLLDDLLDCYSSEEMVRYNSEFENYDLLGKITTILSYDTDPFGQYDLLTTAHIRRIIIRR